MKKTYKFLIWCYFHFFNVIILKWENVRFKNNLKIKGFLGIKNHGEIIIGKNVTINSNLSSNPIGGDSKTYFTTTKTGKILIGDNCGISNSTIFSMCNIIIEDNVLIGGGCKIYDSDFHSIIFKDRNPENNCNINIKSAPVVIESGAWLGGNCTILKGVIIGKRSVIGAGSVITKSVPPDELWAGNPAKFIKYINND